MHVDEHDGDIIVAGLAGIQLGHKSKHLARQFQFIPNKQRSWSRKGRTWILRTHSSS